MQPFELVARLLSTRSSPPGRGDRYARGAVTVSARSQLATATAVGQMQAPLNAAGSRPLCSPRRRPLGLGLDHDRRLVRVEPDLAHGGRTCADVENRDGQSGRLVDSGRGVRVEPQARPIPKRRVDLRDGASGPDHGERERDAVRDCHARRVVAASDTAKNSVVRTRTVGRRSLSISPVLCADRS